MGFFSKLFEKKICDICGGEIGLLGNRKLEDGNCCKNCARKLSPWFDDRRHSTVEQIQQQLAYRERNKQELQNFRVSQVIGDDYKMYIEEVNGLPARFFVTDGEDYLDANPDIIPFENLLSCTTDIDTTETELKREDANGNEISYNPPRYETEYDFYIQMQIGNSPYFDDIRFKLNSSAVVLQTRGVKAGNHLGSGFLGGTVYAGNPDAHRRYQEYLDMCQQIEHIVKRSREPAAPAQPDTPAPTPQAWRCEVCGSCNEGRFCQNCGSKKAEEMPQYKCDKCGWQPADPTKAPKFCPECGDPIDHQDLT